MKHLLRRTLGALLMLFVVTAFAAPGARGALFRPAVEKDPSPEAVNEWESARFIARASGAESFIWRIVSADGATLYNASAAPEYFPGLRVEGADTDTLTLLDIPYTLNGWQAECLFVDENGEKALSGRAALTVWPVGPTETPEPTPTPDTTATPEITSTPEVTPSPEPTGTPEAAPSPAPETPVPTATPAPSASAPLSRRAVLGIFAGVVALALVLGAVSLVLRPGAHSAPRRRK